MNTTPRLVPLLVVRGAARAIDFYARALGATVLTRHEHGPERHLGHADLAIGQGTFSLTEEARAWNSDAPPSLGGSPVLLQLHVEDAAATFAAMCGAGADAVFAPLELLGERMARVCDPFGHSWILRQRLEALSVEEIQRQREELYARAAGLDSEAGSSRALTPQRARNESKLGHSPPPGQAQNHDAASHGAATCPAPRRGRVHLVLGPVGAGKSTFALRLTREQQGIRLTLDAWMASLFRADRPDDGVIAWYQERAARCIEQIWAVASQALEAGTDAVLELGLLKRLEREQMYRRIEDAGFEATVHVLDASRDVRRARVEERNRAQGATFSMVVPPGIFELASDLWEPPGASECEGRDVRFLSTDLA
jgi:uncharacterized glyoxalase superfamily protein PhnB/predicted kinase